ncbi:MAG: nucleotidyltransferase family protein [Gammaproteobacteria bacterium]|nr:nucleotidyltransferase family protein [Gammaproteobacteria bacterium]
MICAVLLAAGSGRRFGSNKLLAPLAEGTPLALAAARVLQAALSDVVAVVRPQDHDLARLFAAQGVRVTPFSGADQGMGASLAFGVRSTSAANGWLVALADMPFIQPATVAAVARLLQNGAPMAAPFYGSQRGHPVGFGRKFFDDLAALEGDSGARALVERYAKLLSPLVCDDPGILIDIDTPRDLQRHASAGGARCS